jgi:23S rRNA (cytidine2498-2'-O)-methyltransferase
LNNSLAAIVSCDEASEAFALGELRPLFSELPAIRWLDSGLALVETGWEHGEFAAELGKAAPVFIRHIAPVQSRFKLDGTTTDIDILQNEVRVFAKQINSSLRFAVQTRIIGVGKLPFRRVTVNETLSDLLTAMTGATLDTRAPDQVVSVLCTPDMGYIGVSLGYQNRSLWPGGAHRFQREDGQISRSEFKLLEAINVFGLGLPTDGTALDMGAAPGGWTRVLRDRGLNVIAVDPADLDLRLFNVTGVRHVRSTIQVYLAKAPKFEVIVNDMRMDASESVELMLRARPHLCDGGLAIVTLKLPEEPRAAQRNPETVRLALERLSAGYIIIGARQLYHNRCEVTVALRASM